MFKGYQYIEQSFIKDYTEIKKQIVNTVVITSLLNKGYKACILNLYLASTQYGYNASAKSEGTHKLLRITDINDGAVDWKSVPYCNCDDEKKYLLNKGDILIARTGGTTGKSFLINDVPSNAIFASYLIRLRANNQCLPEFISIFLNSYAYWSQISEMKSGSAQPNVNAEKLKTLLIPDCPVKVQRKILNIINGTIEEEDFFTIELMTKIKNVILTVANNEELKKEFDKQQTYLQLLRQTILQEAVQGKLTKQDPTDEPATELLKRIRAEKDKLIQAGKLKKERELTPVTKDKMPLELPKGWVWCRLKEFGFIMGGGTPLTTKSQYWNGKIPWITPKDTKADFLNDSEDKVTIEGVHNSSAKLIPPNSILIVGRSGILKRTLPVSINTIECTVNQDLKVLVPYIQEMATYIRLLLKGHEDFILKKLIKYGMTVHSLKYKEFELHPFPLPPLQEQHRIVAKVHQLQQQLNQLEVQVQQSRQYAQQLFQSVLKEAFEQKETIVVTKQEINSLPNKLHGMLLAKIIDAHYKHPKYLPTLGRVKGEKTCHIIEDQLQIDLDRKPVKDAAGPVDFFHILEVEKEAQNANWFEAKQKNSRAKVDYLKGKYFNDALKEASNALKDREESADRIINLFLHLDTEQTEIIATVYAAWNNLLIRQLKLVDDDIITEARENWTKQKLKYPRSKFQRAIEWLRKNQLIPTGKGKVVSSK